MINWLSDPVYGVRPDSETVFEYEDRNDDVELGFAALVHTYHEKVPWLGPVFGLGIGEANRTQFYVGGGIRLGDRMGLSGGWTFGPIRKLPAGIEIDRVIPDGMSLADLPTKIGVGGFFSVSYSFANVRNQLERPFAGGSNEN